MKLFFPLPLHFDNAGMRNGRQCIILTAPFVAVTSLGKISAPAGTISDGASIPQMAQSIVGDRFDYIEEAVIHDYLYSSGQPEYTRAEADYILKELMWNKGIPLWKVSAFYLAVRIGGWKSFKQPVE